MQHVYWHKKGAHCWVFYQFFYHDPCCSGPCTLSVCRAGCVSLLAVTSGEKMCGLKSDPIWTPMLYRGTVMKLNAKYTSELMISTTYTHTQYYLMHKQASKWVKRGERKHYKQAHWWWSKSEMSLWTCKYQHGRPVTEWQEFGSCTERIAYMSKA